MEASRTFNELINKIENSQLNFKISKTPFSAHISLKSSFIRYYDQKPAPVSQHCENVNNQLLKVANEENINLENSLKQERVKVKSLETQLGELRDEMLKIKKEKNILNSSLKVSSTELEEVQSDKRQMAKVTSDFENQLILKCEEVKVKDVECKELKKDNKRLEKLVNESSVELDLVKKDLIQAKVKKELNCSHCDLKFESKVALSQHVRENHYKNQVSQTKEEKTITNCEYLCYYCDYAITSSEDLKKHKGDYPGLDMCQDKCDQCDAKFEFRRDLIDHFKNSHPEISIVWCDFCQAGFETIEELQCHIRMEHRNYLPG